MKLFPRSNHVQTTDAKSTTSKNLGPTFLGPPKQTGQRAVSTLKNMFEKALKFNFFPFLDKPRSYIPIGLFFYFWTNLRHMLVELIVEHIMRPQNSKAWHLKLRTDIVIKSHTMTFYYREMQVQGNKRWCFKHPSFRLQLHLFKVVGHQQISVSREYFFPTMLI